MALIQIRIVGANVKNRKVINTLLSDLKSILGPFVGIYDGKPITIKFGHEHFSPHEYKWLGWQQFDEGRHTICLRPNMPPGCLYVVCMHELGHVIGMNHAKPGHIMSEVTTKGKNVKRLTRKHRIEWLNDFCKSVIGYRIKA